MSESVDKLPVLAVAQSDRDETHLPGPAIGAITAMIKRRHEAKHLMEQAMNLIDQARALAPEYTYEYALDKDISWYTFRPADESEKLRKALDRSCWEALLRETNLGVVMNHEQLRKIREEIKTQAPELTHERAISTFMDLFESRGETFQAGLVDVFRRLHGRYKSHDPFKVKKRLIMQGALSEHGGWSSRYSRDLFADFWKFIYLIEGGDPTLVPQKDTPMAVIDRHISPDEIEFEQFRVVLYQNGNLHIWLDRRLDLVEKVNQQIAAYFGRTLPGRR